MKKVYLLLLLLSSLTALQSKAFVTEKVSFTYGDSHFLSMDPLYDKSLIFNPNYYRGSHNADEITYITREEFRRVALREGFASKKSFFALEKANLYFTKSLTDLLPKLNINFSVNAITAFVSGLIGGFFPSAWFNAASLSDASEAMSFTTLSVLSTLYYNADVFYFNLLQQQRDISIIRSYLGRYKSLASYIQLTKVSAQDDHINDDLVTSFENYLVTLDQQLSEREKLYQNSLSEIPLFIGQSIYIDSNLINLKEFRAEELKLLEKNILKGKIPNEKDAIKMALEESFEIKAAKALRAETVNKQRKDSFSFITSGNNADNLSFILSASAIPQYLIGNAEIRLIDKAIEELKATIQKDVKQNITELDFAQKSYFMAIDGLSKIESNFEKTLADYFGENGPSKKSLARILYYPDIIVDLHIRINDGIFDFLRASMGHQKLTHQYDIEMMKHLPEEYLNEIF